MCWTSIGGWLTAAGSCVAITTPWTRPTRIPAPLATGTPAIATGSVAAAGIPSCGGTRLATATAGSIPSPTIFRTCRRPPRTVARPTPTISAAVIPTHPCPGWWLGRLLDRQADAHAIKLDLDHLDLDLVANLDRFGRIFDEAMR